MTCEICLDKYTKELRLKVTCPYCPSSACRGCIQRYLLSSYDDPHCMGCRRAWNHEFLDSSLTKTFRSGPLRKHRAKILCDREKALLPAMQIFVEATKNSRVAHKEHDKLLREFDGVNAKKSTYNVLRDRLLRAFRQAPEDERQTLKRDLEKNAEELAKNHVERDILQIHLDAVNVRIIRCQNILAGRGDTETREVREFIQRCPADGCRGYLSTAYKCGTCSKFVCPDCLVVKGENRDADHTCDEAAKATAQLIKKETKPCPKCGVRIYKIDGCDQMWCTNEGCHTAFSWNTGRVITGVIHNPHYYEYLRRQNNGAVPREAGDIPCGGLPNAWQFQRHILQSTIPQPEKNTIMAAHRCFSDIINVRIPEYPARRAANTNMEINVKYLMNELAEEDWQKLLEQRETRFERKREIGQILTMFGHVGADIMRQMENTFPRDLKTAWTALLGKQLFDLRKYTNKSLEECGKRMMCAFPQIDRDWNYVPCRKEPTNDDIALPANPYTRAVNQHAHDSWEARRIAYQFPTENA
jgi:hypothetical protein